MTPRTSTSTFRLLTLSLPALSCLAVGCDSTSNSSVDLAHPDLSTSSGDGGAGDMATAPPPIPRYSLGGTVNAVLHAGSAWYLGGTFNRISTTSAPNLIALDATGAATSCPLGAGFDAAITAVAVAGNSIYVGGAFTHYQGAVANRLAKIDAQSCALDTTFSPAASNGVDGLVSALSIAGGALYVGGQFSNYRGASANHLAKIDLTSGALDTTFSPSASNGLDGNVAALAIAGTSLYVGGAFNAYRGVANSAHRLAKLDLTSGAIDTTFSPVGATSNGLDNSVTALATSATSLYVGGFFNAYRGVTNSAVRLAKLDLASGAIDTTFSPVGATSNGVDDVIAAMAFSGSSLYIGGRFTAYRGVAGSATLIAKLDGQSGALDTTFSPPASNGFINSLASTTSQVSALTVAGGSLFVGGTFTGYRGVDKTAYGLAKLDPTSGAQDLSFVPPNSNAGGISGGVSPNPPTVNALQLLGTTLWVGGRFTVYGGYSANNLVKLDDSSFAVDTTFSPAQSNGFDSSVNALTAAGTSIYVGGAFTAYRSSGSSANHLAKLDAQSGAIDTAFSPVGATSNGFDKSVAALTVAGSSLYVGGSFAAYRGVANSANALAKLDLISGAIDTAFSPPGATANGFDSGILALAVAGSSLYAGGTFGTYRGVAGAAKMLAKLDLISGARDVNFIPAAPGGFDSSVSALAVAGSSLYVGGAFTAFAGVTDAAHRLAKLDLSSGTLDTTFSPPGATANGFDASVSALAVAGSSLYVGGSFTAYRGLANSANRLAKLDLSSGTLDTTFGPVGATANGVDATINALAAFGPSLVLGGAFTSYRGATTVTRALLLLDPTTAALR